MWSSQELNADLKVVLVTEGAPYSDVGGGYLRRKALEQALSEVFPILRFYTYRRKQELCLGECEHTDDSDGRPDAPVDPYPQAYCPRVSQELQNAVVTTGADIAIFSGIGLHRYLVDVRQRTRCRCVYDAHNAEGDLRYSIAAAIGRTGSDYPDYKRRYRLSHCEMVSAIENYVWHQAHQIWTCTEPDRLRIGALLRPNSSVRVRTVVNAVDLASYAFRFDVLPRRLLFLGRLDYYPNIEAVMAMVGEILPCLRQRKIAVEAVVAGYDPPERLRLFCAAHSVSLHANVADIKSYLPGSIMMVPLTTGGGGRLKILEAFAAGTPVISSQKGIEGIAAEPNTHFLAADTTADFCEAIESLLLSTNAHVPLVRSAYELVGRHYSIGAMRRQVEEALAVIKTQELHASTRAGRLTVDA